MSGPPIDIGVAQFELKRTDQRDLRHVERAAHLRMVDLRFPEIGHAPAALSLVLDDCRRAFVLGTVELASPDGEPVQQAARQGLEAP